MSFYLGYDGHVEIHTNHLMERQHQFKPVKVICSSAKTILQSNPFVCEDPTSNLPEYIAFFQSNLSEYMPSS